MAEKATRWDPLTGGKVEEEMEGGATPPIRPPPGAPGPSAGLQTASPGISAPVTVQPDAHQNKPQEWKPAAAVPPKGVGLFGDSPLVHTSSSIVPTAPAQAPPPAPTHATPPLPNPAHPQTSPTPPSRSSTAVPSGSAAAPMPFRMQQVPVQPQPARSHPLAAPSPFANPQPPPHAPPQHVVPTPPSAPPPLDVSEMARKFLGRYVPAPKRLSVADVSHDLEGLMVLAKAGAWRALIQLSAEILRSKPEIVPGGETTKDAGMDPKERLLIMQLRLAAQLRARSHKAAADELNALGDLAGPKYRFDTYPSVYEVKKGSFVPFSMWLIQAEITYAAGKHREAIDLLYNLLHKVRQKEIGEAERGREGTEIVLNSVAQEELQLPPLSGTDTQKLRENACLCALVNMHLDEREYYPTIALLDTLSTNNPESTHYMWALCRVHLIFGSVKAATATAELCRKKEPEVTLHTRIHEGFLKIAQGNYPEALVDMRGVVEADPTNSVAAVNMALCLMYTKQITQAVQMLEGVIKADPVKCMTYPIVFNLCTLYDKQGTEAAVKNRMIHHLAKIYGAEDLDLTACKL